MVLLPDLGERYLSTTLFRNSNGSPPQAVHGDSHFYFFCHPIFLSAGIVSQIAGRGREQNSPVRQDGGWSSSSRIRGSICSSGSVFFNDSAFELNSYRSFPWRSYRR